jgi:hypothetical protein
MTNFQVGDRVRVKSDADTFYAGMHGSVVSNPHPEDKGTYPIGIHVDYTPDRCFEIDPSDFEPESKFLPRKGSTDLFHDGEYFVFETKWEGEKIAVSPAHGYDLNWGHKPDSKWVYTPSQFMQKYYPGEGR